MSTIAPDATTTETWTVICRVEDLREDAGVAVLHAATQVALFLIDDAGQPQVYALDNRDPKSGANVMARSIVGHMAGEFVAASPIYKQHFRLKDGACVEDAAVVLKTWPVRLREGAVEIVL